MLTLKVFTVITARQPFVREGEAEYSKRLERLAKLQLRDVKSFERSSPLPKTAQKKESSELLKNFGREDFLIVLDRTGKQFSSEELAAFLQNKMTGGLSTLNLAIGGSHGWDQDVLNRANVVWSLSKLTFTSQLSRLLVLEQLYRALTILHGQPYHK